MLTPMEERRWICLWFFRTSDREVWNFKLARRKTLIWNVRHAYPQDGNLRLSP